MPGPRRPAAIMALNLHWLTWFGEPVLKSKSGLAIASASPCSTGQYSGCKCLHPVVEVCLPPRIVVCRKTNNIALSERPLRAQRPRLQELRVRQAMRLSRTS